MAQRPYRQAPGFKENQRAANRASWDERVPLHLTADSYDLTPLRSGRGALNPIEDAELGSVDGFHVLHLQCHFGRDSLTLAQRGADVVGLDFSPAAIAAARDLAAELGLADRARFVEADLYDAPAAIQEPGAFDRVFVTWGALCWLPDIVGWAEIVAHFLKPGGALYLAEGHPAALVFDDAAKESRANGEPGDDRERGEAGLPGWFWPYFCTEPFVDPEPRDYTGDAPRLHSGPTFEWVHPLGNVITALCEAGLTLKWLHEHDAVPWPMFACLRGDADGLWRWPDKSWLPLSYSLWAERG